MEVNISWWMYLLNAFTPFIAFGMLIASKQKKQDQTSSKQALPPMADAIATLMTYMIMAGLLYAFWFAAHWLIFWLLDKPLHIALYFDKPLIAAYWFPYLFGLLFVPYSLLIAPKITRLRVEAILNRVLALGFLASFYMVCITYLKWLAI
jgi:hypothetical protein